jgi:hypothetical protein
MLARVHVCAVHRTEKPCSCLYSCIIPSNLKIFKAFLPLYYLIFTIDINNKIIKIPNIIRFSNIPLELCPVLFILRETYKKYRYCKS